MAQSNSTSSVKQSLIFMGLFLVLSVGFTKAMFIIILLAIVAK